ncbi:hypothetical protein D3C81_772690 [compost metagenome]
MINKGGMYMIISSYFSVVKMDKQTIEKVESLEIVATLLGYVIVYKDYVLSFNKNGLERFYILYCKGVEKETIINFWYVVGKTNEFKEKIMKTNQTLLDVPETISIIEGII